MLPRADDTTLSRYLLSVASAINQQINRGLVGDAAARLRECATIVARVAQQIDDRSSPAEWSAATEADALETTEAEFAQAEARRLKANLDDRTGLTRHIDGAQVEAYLRGHALGSPDLSVKEARLLPGGRCKLTALVSQEGSKHLPSSFILRQDWEGGATDTTVAGEYTLLQRVVSGGVRAPRPLLLEPDQNVLGAPFILLERMRGQLAGSLFTPPKSRSLALQLAEQLARLHSLPIAEMDFLPRSEATSPGTLAATIEAFRRMQATLGIRCRTVDAAIDWLSEHAGGAGSTRCVVHNDVGFHNILVVDDELAAILDWELAQIGHPAGDLGYVKPFIGQMMPWPEFIAHYTTSGGWPVDAATLRFHTLWNGVRLYGLIMQARAALAAGHVNDVEITFACADNLMLLLQSMARELREAGAL